MDIKKIETLIKKIEEAELVLIGIGEEWGIPRDNLLNNSYYEKFMQTVGENSDLLPFMEKALIDFDKIEGVSEKIELYKKLRDIVANKNYFVVSLCTDGLIEKAGFKEERIVQPCGTITKLQCSEKCTTEIYDSDKDFIKKIAMVAENNSSVEELKVPVCPHCGKPLVFNNIYAQNYAEEGYLDKWQIYMKWLQGTVNRNTCIIELGVGMRFPSVIRWPFEKIAFFNQKATFFRVHSKLYQTTEEIKEKSYGIKAEPAEFLKELYNRL